MSSALASKRWLDDVFQASLTARRTAYEQLVDYVQRSAEVTLDEVDDTDFPTRFTITFRAASFAPPIDELARPAHPIPREIHTFEISLPSDYPVGAPEITWLTPIFHPNISAGTVCLSLASTSVIAACQAAIALAAYLTYEVRPEDFDGSGFLNLAAAAWALSADGQKAIIESGGSPLVARARPQPHFFIITPIE